MGRSLRPRSSPATRSRSRRRSGQQLQFKIDNVDATGVQGGGQRVAYNDIQSISRKQMDTKRTTMVVLGVLAAGALAAAAGGGGGGSSY